MKNCTNCKLAKDQGKDFACRFSIDKWFAKAPYPGISLTINLTRKPIRKDRMPATDCPAWKSKRGVSPEARS